MTESKEEEMVIATTCLDPEKAADRLASMRDADREAGGIANAIVRLKNDLNDLREKRVGDATETDEREMCRVERQLADAMERYGAAVERVLKLAEKINFDADGLQYRKVDIGRPAACPKDAIVDDDGELLDPVICLDRGTSRPKVFVHGNRGSENRIYEIDDEQLSFCSCVNDGGDDGCDDDDDDDEDGRSDCCARAASDCCAKPAETPDYERDAIRDDLMAMKGGVKLLGEQNAYLLSRLNGSPAFSKCKGVRSDENCDTRPNVRDLLCENDRLRDELKEMKRDRCQIELAKKILNVADSPCADCAGLTDRTDAFQSKFKALTEEHDRLLADRNSKLCENEELRSMLDDAKHRHKSCEDRLAVTNAQVAQLEKQLFHFVSTRSNDSEVLASNEKYVIENLRHRLQEAAEEKASMQMVLDFHLSELEDKKTKYLAVLQTNEGQRLRIDTLCKEKKAIANEYEAKFNQMDVHVKSRLKEIGELPGLLAAAQRDSENERSARLALESERDALLNQIDSLRVCLAHGNDSNAGNAVKDLEERNLQLKAKIVTLEHALAENERLYTERTHYSLQLKEHLDAVREEAAVQVTKIKDYTECQKQLYTDYIQKLERQLAESRALACAEFKKREHVDELLRSRIEILTGNLAEANKKIKGLFNAKDMIETKLVEEVLCKVPAPTVTMVESSCKRWNTPKSPDTHARHGNRNETAPAEKQNE